MRLERFVSVLLNVLHTLSWSLTSIARRLFLRGTFPSLTRFNLATFDIEIEVRSVHEDFLLDLEPLLSPALPARVGLVPLPPLPEKVEGLLHVLL